VVDTPKPYSSKKAEIGIYYKLEGSFRLLTEDLFVALKPIRVKSLDHVIIGEDSVFSLADNDIMDEIAFSG